MIMKGHGQRVVILGAFYLNFWDGKLLIFRRIDKAAPVSFDYGAVYDNFNVHNKINGTQIGRIEQI